MGLWLRLAAPGSAATLSWTGSVNTNWDTATANFNGAVFSDGDDVRFVDAGVVHSNITLIGALSPGSITISNTSAKPFTFTNGVLAGSGALLKAGPGTATFQSYLSGLDFAGGTLVQSGHVRWVFSLAGTGAKTNHFGTGPITLDGGNFQLHNTGTPTFRLTNAVTVTANGGSLSVAGNQAGSGQTLPNIRFTGPIHLAGRLTIGQIVGGGGNAPGPHYDGTITIDQTTPGPRVLVIANGGNAAPTLAGNIVDGPGPASNVLVIGPWDSGNGRDVTIAGTANTYAAGTLITNFGGSRLTIVQTNASLGLGDVLIVSNATLRLTGRYNLGSNAHVNVQGTLVFTNAVTNFIDRLTFGTNSYTKGVWHPGNAAPYLQGQGAFDLGVNDLPVVTILTPTNGQVLIEGDTVPYVVSISDSDPITQADFRVNGVSAGILGAEPWATNWSYVPIGAQALSVIATDFNTATGTSAVVHVTVVAPTPAALTWNGLQNRLWDTLSTNWTGGRTIFHKDDTVTFDDTAPGPVHLPWNVFPASATFHATGHYTLSGASLASGPLTKSGAGTLTLSNHVAGPIVLQAGTLVETRTNSCALRLAGGLLRGVVFTGPIQLTGAVEVEAQSLTGPISANGTITGVGALVMAGNITNGSIGLANVTLTGTNTTPSPRSAPTSWSPPILRWAPATWW